MIMESVNKTTKVQIELWSDFLCPYCYVGERNLEVALGQFTHSDEVKVVRRAFELHPDAPRSGGEPVIPKETVGNGAEREKATRRWDKIKAYAAAAGLDYNVDGIHIDNTFDAHRLVKLAEEYGKDGDVSERLFDAHFVKGLNIADKSVLTDIAVAAGLDCEGVAQTLGGTRFVAQVRQDEQDAEALNFEYIPAYYVDRKRGINGVKSVDDILNLLNDAWNNTSTVGSSQTDGPACGIHGCD